jgi:hypothetical protein
MPRSSSRSTMETARLEIQYCITISVNYTTKVWLYLGIHCERPADGQTASSHRRNITCSPATSATLP